VSIFFGGVCRACQAVTLMLEYDYAGKTWIDVGRQAAKRQSVEATNGKMEAGE